MTTDNNNYKFLKPTKFKSFKKQVYGFDCETANDNKTFVSCAIVGKDFSKTFRNKRNAIEFLKHPMFRNSIIVATNCAFDWNALFYGEPEAKQFYFCERKGRFLAFTTYSRKGKFTNIKINGKRDKVQFIDTMNYAPFSVEKWGKMLGMPKMKHPSCFGKYPATKEEWAETLAYNKNDALISREAFLYLVKAFEQFGCTVKLTVASSGLARFTNLFLDKTLFRHPTNFLKDLFEGYYGGRTEAFARGTIRSKPGLHYRLYDVRSMYPSVMLNSFPDPNVVRCRRENTTEYFQYHGQSLVTVRVPPSRYPLLPYPLKDKQGKRLKLLFPVGEFTAWQNHIELREAIKDGVEIVKVHKSYFYPFTMHPFKDFVTTLYDARLALKKKSDPMEEVVKLLLNGGCYGKFGEKFDAVTNIVPFNHTVEQLARLKRYEPYDDANQYLRVYTEETEPRKHCIPIWASCVTSYARVKLWHLIKESGAIYCDTDSILCTKKMPESEALGGLQLEGSIREGIIVKPKLYGITLENGSNIAEKVKIKGIRRKLQLRELYDLTSHARQRVINGVMREGHFVEFEKFVKLREALIRNYHPNEIITVVKNLGLNDDKRCWSNTFTGVFEWSTPVLVGNFQNVEHSVNQERTTQPLVQINALVSLPDQ